mgnify:CR=1 FL=1
MLKPSVGEKRSHLIVRSATTGGTTSLRAAMGRSRSESSSSSGDSSSSSSSSSASRRRRKRKREKKESSSAKRKRSSSSRGERKKDSGVGKKRRRSSKARADDRVAERLKRTMASLTAPRASDDEKRAAALEKHADKLFKRARLPDEFERDRRDVPARDPTRLSAVMRGAKGAMSAAEARAYDLHMEQMRGGHGGAARSFTTY